MGNNLFGAGRYSEERETDDFRGIEAAATVSHDSTYEFKQFVVNEFSKSSNAIGEKFTEFMKLRDIKLAELEEEVKKLKHLETENERLGKALENSKDFIVKLSRELQSKNQANDHQTQVSECYKEKIVALKKELEAKNEEILKLSKLIDPMRQLRRKGHCIQPGDTMHEDVVGDYKQLFVQKKLLEPIGKKEAGERASELRKLLEIAYGVCKDHLLEIAKKELAKLFQPPDRVLTEQERKDEDIYLPWQSRQEALSLLLSNLEIQFLPDNLTVEVIKKLDMYESADMQTVLKRVTELTWKMVKLSPPVSFGDLSFSEDLDLYDVTDLNDLLGAKENYTIEYRRPILFYGPLGIVGSKGSVVISQSEHSKLVGASDKVTSDNVPGAIDLTEEEEKYKSKENEEKTHLYDPSKLSQESVQCQSGADINSKQKRKRKRKKKSKEKENKEIEQDTPKSDSDSNNSDNELDKVD